MNQYHQTPTQTILQHGESVRNHFEYVVNYLDAGFSLNWKIPIIIQQNRKLFRDNLLGLEIIKEYCLFHDVGKVFCRTVDQDGKQHFPNHAEVSYQTWVDNGGDAIVGNLIRQDMMVHTIRSSDIQSFVEKPEATSLLLVGLSEIHSNAQMFGGIDSISFKIKYKQLDKVSKHVAGKLLEKQNDIGKKNDK